MVSASLPDKPAVGLFQESFDAGRVVVGHQAVPRTRSSL
jgi:hypothetical protein